MHVCGCACVCLHVLHPATACMDLHLLFQASNCVSVCVYNELDLNLDVATIVGLNSPVGKTHVVCFETRCDECAMDKPAERNCVFLGEQLVTVRF